MKLYKLFIAVMACSIMTSCSDWLDYTPKDKQTYDQQFGTKAGFHNAVTGVYAKMANSSLYGYNLTYGPLDIMGQLYVIPNSNASNLELKSATWTGEYASSVFSSIWSSAYSTVLNANLVLQAAEEANGTILSAHEYKLIKGEMLGLRAFLHFDLLRLFGPVYTKNPEGLSIPYTDGVEAVKRDRLPANKLVSDYLLPDLNKAEELLAEVDPILEEGVLNSDGGLEGNWERYRQLRMNYYAVVLLKARLYLWTGDYDNALIEAQKITDDTKVAEFFPNVNPNRLLANSTNPDRGFSTECLFGFYENAMADIYLDTFSGSLDPSSVLQPRAGYMDLLFSSASDYRRQSQWTGSVSSSGGDHDFIKYKSFTANKNNPEFWATFYGLIRKSEAYYIAAECLMKKQDLPNACAYLNQVLTARGVEPLPSTTNATTLLKQIKLEYLREFRGEGQIYYLFKRYEQVFAQYYSGEPDLDAAENLLFNDTNHSVRYTVPVPAEENN